MGEEKMEPREKVKLLPEKPGVYLMKNDAGKIIYIGKAKVLKNRVSQYFTGEHDVKTTRMVSQIHDFDFIVVGTEMEALVLECSLIKHYKPKYNILLKDDKNYNYIKVELKKPYPRLTVSRRVDPKDGSRYFGPYSGMVQTLVASLNKIFRLPTCKRNFPADIGKDRPCLNLHIGCCCGVCTGNVSKEDYGESIDQLLSLLEGKYEQVEKQLTDRMMAESDRLNFEAAARLRDQLKTLRLLKDRQRVVSDKQENKDVVALYQEQDKSCFLVLIIRGGRLIDSHHFLFPTHEAGEDSVLEELLKQYYQEKTDIPKRIYLSEAIADKTLIEDWLCERVGYPVHLTVPREGVNLRLSRMAMENAAEVISVASTAQEKQRRVLLELQELLALREPPEYIEAMDISNTGASNIVGAIVRFKNGKPDRAGYRKFRINSTSGQDDYGAHREMLYRRLKRYLDGDEHFAPLPGLLLIDGGKGHVAAAQEVLDELRVQIPVFGMVKDSRHRVRGLIAGKEELGLPITSRAFFLIAQIDEEVHRCAIEYHRQLRGKTAVHSRLLEIEGIGETRCKRLLTKFRTLDGVKNATVEELCAVKGMDRNAALAVRRYFGHRDDSD